jgi:lysophospholipase L1-like esterase
VAQAKTNRIDILFMGDSITDNWRNRGSNVWNQYYAPRRAANFGISGDRTQHVLWRVENGELENIHPKVCVLMIGTNNIGGSAASSEPADRIAKGVKMIVDDVRTKTGAKVLLLAIFPRGMDPKDPKTIALRAKVDEINKMIATADDGKNVRYLDIGEKFLQPDGTLPKDVMPDALHPNAKGYQIWADAIDAQLKEMMQ